MIDNLRPFVDFAEALFEAQTAIDFREPISLLSGALTLPGWAAPSVALGTLFALVILSGIALGSIAVLIATLWLAHVLLEEVLGIQVEVRV